MKKVIKRLFTCVLGLLFIIILAPFTIKTNAELKYPNPTQYKYINDYSNIIDISVKEYIMSVGKELEDKTGAQETIVIIDSLEGQDIESFANGLFREWGIGQSDKDNGFLILIALNDNRWRVEVGRGLEGAVPDIII